MKIALRCGDALDILQTLPPASVDAIVTDPPYGLKFLGHGWDYGVPGTPYWTAALEALKPGGYMFAFGGTRTYHRLTCAIEDAGFEIRDCVMWLYGQGYPKSRACLKPAWEPITLARKRGPKVRHFNIDACRIPILDAAGRWPANVTHDGSDEVMETFAAFGPKTSGKQTRQGHVRHTDKFRNVYGKFAGRRCEGDVLYGDSGSIARFYYCTKASRKGIPHPTVKPTELMRWLIRLITQPGDTVLDPFCGSGSTGIAAAETGCQFLGIDINPDCIDLAITRILLHQLKGESL